MKHQGHITTLGIGPDSFSERSVIKAAWETTISYFFPVHFQNGALHEFHSVHCCADNIKHAKNSAR